MKVKVKKAKKVIVSGLVAGLVFTGVVYASDTTYEAKAEIGWQYDDGDEHIFGAVCQGNGFRIDGNVFEFEGYPSEFEVTENVVLVLDSMGTETYTDDFVTDVYVD